MALQDDIASGTASLAQLEGALAVLQQNAAAIERAERERASCSPLTVMMEVVSCQWAVLKWHTDRTIPEYDFPTEPCYQGKLRPDQECRNCRFHTLIRYGNHLPVHRVRYAGHGFTAPVPDEEAAMAVSRFLADKGLTAARLVTAEIRAVETAIGNLKVWLEQRRREEMEAAQGARPETAARRTKQRPSRRAGQVVVDEVPGSGE